MSFPIYNLTSPFVAPAGFVHDLSAENRLDRILEVGELIPKILSSGKKLVEKFFPGNPESLTDLAGLAAELDEATSFFDEQLRSSAHGGTKTVLHLMMAHYPETEAWRIASGFPLEKEDGTPLDDQDRRKILQSVSGYASKVATMVSLTTIFKEVSCPPTPVQSDDDGEEADKSS